MKNFLSNIYADIFNLKSPGEMSMSEILASAKRQGIVLAACVIGGALPFVVVVGVSASVGVSVAVAVFMAVATVVAVAVTVGVSTAIRATHDNV